MDWVMNILNILFTSISGLLLVGTIGLIIYLSLSDLDTDDEE